MKKTPEDLIADIKSACDLLGWRVAICGAENLVNGLIVGDLDYIKETVSQLENLDEYEISAEVEHANTELH